MNNKESFTLYNNNNEFEYDKSKSDIHIKFNKAKPSIPFDMFLDCSKAKKQIDW